MDFTVPQFINKEAKIVGPLTFKQFFYFLVAGGVAFISYFMLSKKNPTLYYVVVAISVVIASAFAFLKIKGSPLQVFLKHFFSFTISSKIFVWRRKIMPPKAIKLVSKAGKEKEEAFLRGGERSSLQKLSTRVETRGR